MTRNFQIPLLRRDRVCFMALVLFAHASVWAHGEADDPLPVDVGWSAQARVALRAAELKGDLPSVAMAGFLSPGGAGDALRTEAIEHASLAASWRFTPQWGARVQLAQHDGDDPELEDAWVQWRQDRDNGDAWWLNAGRMTPAQGAALAEAGVFDDFTFAPLAQTLAWGHAMGEDGLQLSWRGTRAGLDWAMDAGLWRGRHFPADGSGTWAPSAHVGAKWHAWSVDGFWLSQRVQGRGQAILGVAGHSHVQPVCDQALREVVCFSGDSELRGASLRWRGPSDTDGALTAEAGGWQRVEHGRLRSSNGDVAYQGDGKGLWLTLAWRPQAQWSVSTRLERAQMQARLSGVGASLVADEAGMRDYQPIKRESLSLAYQWRPWSRWVLSAGREQAGRLAAAHFVSARWVMQWGAGAMP